MQPETEPLMETRSGVCKHPCMKCVPGNDVGVRYHPRRSYCDPHSRYTFSSRDDEHLHYTFADV